jgi:RNA polymerase II subunit A-like phosphatase
MVRSRPGSGLRIVEGVAPSTSSYVPPSGTDTPGSSSGTLDGISEKELEQESDEPLDAGGEDEEEEDDFDGFAQEFDRELAEMETDENDDDGEDIVGGGGAIATSAQNEHSQSEPAPKSPQHLIDLRSPITDSFSSLVGAGGSIGEVGGGGSANSAS